MDLDVIISEAVTRAFSERGRVAGRLGGFARAAILSRDRRVEIARKAAQASVAVRQAKANARRA